MDGSFYEGGRVEVCNGTFYGSVCDLGWDEADAQVVCRDYFGEGYSEYNSTQCSLFVYLFVCLFGCLLACLLVCLFVCLFVCLLVCWLVCLLFTIMFHWFVVHC